MTASATPSRSRRPRGLLARLLDGVPVVLVLAVLSAAAVVGLLRPPTIDLATTASGPDAAVTVGGADGPTEIDLDRPPEELPPVGSYARATVRPDGAVEVVEWVRTARRSGSLAVSLPSGAPAGVAAADVVVTTGDGPADGPSEVTASASYLPARASKVFVVRYVLTGGARISPSSPTRALVRPVTLTTEVSGPDGVRDRGPRLLAVESATVLALACSIRGDDTNLTPCGTVTDGEWQVEMPATDWSTLVVAQVELV